MKRGAWLVANHLVADGIGGHRETTYKYSGGEYQLGKLWIGDVAHQPPVESYVDAPRREQQPGTIALAYRWNRCKEPLHIVWVKVARRLAILLERFSPCLSGILRIPMLVGTSVGLISVLVSLLLSPEACSSLTS